MSLTFRRAAIVNNRRFDVGARDRGVVPIAGVNSGVDRIIEEYLD